MTEEEEKPIRVVDRRMFTPDGELRPEYRTEDEGAEAPEKEKESASATAEAGKPPSTAPRSGESARGASPGEPQAREAPGPSERGEEPGAGQPRGAFGLIVQLLAMPAYAALGMVEDPATGRRRVDLAAAQEMIDLLTALEQKTRGNLSFEESNFLSRVLYDLRLAFVEMSRPPAK